METDPAAVRQDELNPLECIAVANQIPLAGMGGPDAELFRCVIARQVGAPEHEWDSVRDDQILVFARVQTDPRADATLVERLVRRGDTMIERRRARWNHQEERP